MDWRERPEEQRIVVRLMTQGSSFSYTDRSELLNLIGELIQGLIPRYRKLAESGQIELSTTPHYHPLAPLLIDFSSARDSMPGVNCRPKRLIRAERAGSYPS